MDLLDIHVGGVSNMSDQYSDFDVFSELLDARTLFLYEEINAEVTARTIATLIYLDKLDSESEIIIYINSPGGDISCFFAIYDTFQLIASPIKTICLGEASSAAAILLAAGNIGNRFVSHNSEIMIHNIQVSELEGSKTEVEREVEKINAVNKQVIEILARHSGQLYKTIEEDCKIDKYLSASEAIKYGLADELLPLKKSIPPLRKRQRK